jgi:hypothetical protein
MPNSYHGAYDVINAFKSVDSFSGDANQLNNMALNVMNFGAEDIKNLKDFLNLVAPFYAEVVAGDPYPDIDPRVGMTHDELMDRERMYSVLIDAVRGRGPIEGGRRRRRATRKHKKAVRKHKKAATRKHRANKNKSRKNKSRKSRGRK